MKDSPNVSVSSLCLFLSISFYATGFLVGCHNELGILAESDGGRFDTHRDDHGPMSAHVILNKAD